MAVAEYELAGQILKYKRLRNVAMIVLIFGVALGIAGGVMLGVGIKKKSDADNKQCTDPVNVITCASANCPTSTTKSTENGGVVTPTVPVTIPNTTVTNPPSTGPPGTCPPCSCSSVTPISTTKKPFTIAPTIPLSTAHSKPIPVYTTHGINSPATLHPIGQQTTKQFQTTPISYPPNSTYYPCLSNIVIAFEASADVSTANIYKPQVDFIVDNLLLNNAAGGPNNLDWNFANRIAYAAFEKNTVHWQKFEHFKNMSDLRISIGNEKQILGFSSYQKLFDVLINNATYYDTQHRFVNTIIFTSNNILSEIHTHVDDAKELNRRGRLIIVTTKDGIIDSFLPWVEEDRNRIIYYNQMGSDGYPYQAYSIVKAFHCP